MAALNRITPKILADALLRDWSFGADGDELLNWLSFAEMSLSLDGAPASAYGPFRGVRVQHEIMFGNSPNPNDGILVELFPTIEVPPNVQGAIETDMSMYAQNSLYGGNEIALPASPLETTVSSEPGADQITVADATGAVVGGFIGVVHTPANANGIHVYQVIGIATNTLTLDRNREQSYASSERVAAIYVDSQYVHNEALGGVRIKTTNQSSAGGGDARVRIRLALDAGDEQT